ncbi:MAG: hypothetical protein LUH47_03525 [Clostridiales bacterium]|nr:hypothetical protein [Clostridiales bacterium]
MNKKFKRALSSILAFVMVVSTLTIMNVSSVLADDSWVLKDDSTFTGYTYDSNNKTVTSGDLSFTGGSANDAFTSTDS